MRPVTIQRHARDRGLHLKAIYNITVSLELSHIRQILQNILFIFTI
jgi:hypothetical protein